MFLSIIIPVYKVESYLCECLDSIASSPLDCWEAILVDDGSPDGTADIVRSLQLSYPERLFLIERSGKLGLGTAYIAGFKWALEHEYDAVFEMDCDFSHNPDDLLRLASTMEEGADVVVGSRYVVGVNVVNWPLSRLLMSYFASKYVRLITRMPVNDATAGFVGYRREVLQSINLDKVQMVGYGFQIEMKYTAWKLGFKIREVSIIFVDRVLGSSKMSSGIFGEAFFGVLKLPFRKINRRK